MRITPESIRLVIQQMADAAAQVGTSCEHLDEAAEDAMPLFDVNYLDMEQKYMNFQALHLALLQIAKYLDREAEKLG